MDWVVQYWWAILWGIIVLVPLGFAIAGRLEWRTLAIIEGVLLLPFVLIFGLLYLLLKSSGNRSYYDSSDEGPYYMRRSHSSRFANSDLYSAPGLNSVMI
ncbi:hypothetical protein CY91_00210 [Dehalococcoides mccartyi]|nr:hypothetical protein CY91_00210 [Dehalococcoides mccartyi]